MAGAETVTETATVTMAVVAEETETVIVTMAVVEIETETVIVMMAAVVVVTETVTTAATISAPANQNTARLHSVMPAVFLPLSHRSDI
ncbi:MAG: hypothetical protein Q4F28_12365 [Eubacteriales bacterium]|nr:hypothetical protein [Eubacteriales bacterium]